METKETFESRRSVHHYDTTKSVSDEQLKKLFDLVKLSPSGYNLQPWEFVIYRDMKNKEAIRKLAYDQKQVTDASAIIVVLGAIKPSMHGKEVFDDWAKKGYLDEETARKTFEQIKQWDKWDESQRKLWTTRSSALACMALMTAARDLGMDTGPMEGFDFEKVRDYTGCGKDYWPIMLIALGYRTSEENKLTMKMRRGPNEIVHLEGFGKRLA